MRKPRPNLCGPHIVSLCGPHVVASGWPTWGTQGTHMVMFAGFACFSIQIWCVLRDQLAITFTQVRGGVNLHVRTCAPLFHILQTAGRIAFKFCV